MALTVLFQSQTSINMNTHYLSQLSHKPHSICGARRPRGAQSFPRASSLLQPHDGNPPWETQNRLKRIKNKTKLENTQLSSY